MKAPEIPKNENERLVALRSYGVLDTPAEDEFDDITRLASEICGAPIALVSLVDEKRQWFKSRFGLDATETPRELAFCAHAIHEQAPMVVEDAFVDDRFKDNPLVTGAPHVRFYAGAPLRNPEGFPIGTLCVIDTVPRRLTDQQLRALNTLSKLVISGFERRKMHQDVIDNRRLLEDLLHALPVAVFAKNPGDDYRYVLWNKTAEEIIGVSSRECLGRNDFDLFPREQAERFREADIQAQQNGKILDISEVRITRDDGVRYLRTKKSFLRNSRGDLGIILGVSEDITEVREARLLIEEQQLKLVASAKFSALGEMAGGIAHEINNPLTIIRCKASQMKDALEQENVDPARLSLELAKIETTVDRIARVIRGLRAFARDSENDPMSRTPLSTIVSDALDLCGQRLKSRGVTLRMGTLPAVEVECRATQISQILVNLLNNSFDAIDSRPERWIGIEGSVSGNLARISITDSGPGINPEIRAKIMHPFFTTKPVGKGTGLGLSISRGIAEQHGGTLEYDGSHPNTRFVLNLPVQQGGTDAVAPRPRAA